MAIIWQKKTKDSSYEVRTAGETVRLYTHGVFHSHYNPKHVVTRNVWDLLFLPALLYPAGSIKRVLVLGVGGGVAIHQLNHFVKPDAIVGVELNPIHIQVAKRFFKVNYKNTQLVEADAVQWVELYSGEPFDLVIDDIYGEEDGEPIRPIAADSAWFNKLLKLLTPKGMLVTNFVTPKEYRQCAYHTDAKIQRKFNCAYKLTTRLYENNIGAFLRSEQSVQTMKNNMAEYKALSNKGFDQTFRITKVRR